MRRALLSLGLGALLLGSTPGAATAQSVNAADRVEEDWVLVVDATVSPNGPQVNTVMSPTADLSQPAVILDINYRNVPAFASGGLQALVYNKNGLQSSQTLSVVPMATPNETVQWTQRMTVNGGIVCYSIPSVNSTTWGTFTTDQVLAMFITPLASLNSYDPAASASNSGAPWKTQGLVSLTLVQVRYYLAGVLIATDKTARVVDCTQPYTKP